jgi:hypothetical protein
VQGREEKNTTSGIYLEDEKKSFPNKKPSSRDSRFGDPLVILLSSLSTILTNIFGVNL